MTKPEPKLGRRRLLQAGAASLGGLAVGAAGASAIVARDGDESALLSPEQKVPFFGQSQSGVATAQQTYLTLLGIDLFAPLDGDALKRLLSLLSDDAARLTQGRGALADGEPELAIDPARLTVTFGFGPAVVEKLVAEDNRPTGFAELPEFSIDKLQKRWGQTDLVVQVCGDDPLKIAHARRLLERDCRRLAKITWTQSGFIDLPAPRRSARNLFGQVDGTINPRADADFNDMVWSSGPWSQGTLLAVRRIRMDMDLWDEADRESREVSIGRRLDNGAPLTGGEDEFADADLAARDDLGLPVIDPASHLRRARGAAVGAQFLRRSYSYQTDVDSGLIFMAYAADLAEQFVPVQQRLADLDLLNTWTTPIGSAVYALPPGAAEGEFVGQRVLS